MKKSSGKQHDRRNRAAKPVTRLLKWMAVIAGVALVLYAISQMSGVAYDEEDIAVVEFSGLSPSEKRTALQAANRARCTCGCGMNMAQCVATDMTCPVRDRNIQSIRGMVREADKS